MAEFKPAYQKVGIKEGGYVHDPDDKGGETYTGISRVHNPDWQGWHLIDSLKLAGEFPGNLPGIVALSQLVEGFYRELWDSYRLGDVADQACAYEFYEQRVHMGPFWPVIHLQKSCNALNFTKGVTKTFLFSPLDPDGAYGRLTLTAFMEVAMEHPAQLLKTLNCFQGVYYAEHPQKKYIVGFLNQRVEL